MAEIIRSALLGQVPHGFSTRTGLGADDLLPGGTLVRASQVHSSHAVTVIEPWEVPPEADALVTVRPGLVLSIVTADCAPVLFHDPSAQVVGAAHAGWRGAHGGILEATVTAMEALGARAERIRAVVGPTIAMASYEVDDGFREQFDDGDARFFHPGREGHWQFNLPAYVVHRLQRAGVGVVEDLALDTYADEGRFFSFRRATHRGEDTGGRQVSAIALPQ